MSQNNYNEEEFENENEEYAGLEFSTEDDDDIAENIEDNSEDSSNDSDIDDVINTRMKFLQVSSDSSTDSDEQLMIMTQAVHVHQLRVQQFIAEGSSSSSRGGSVFGRTDKRKLRNHQAGTARLLADYFNTPSTYGPDDFRRRFRMSKNMFMRIFNAVVGHDNYFVQKANSAGTMGCSPYQKIVGALRVIAYGIAPDAFDEVVRMGSSTIQLSLERFCVAIIEIFGEEYLRSPTQSDVNKLIRLGAKRGFPGMLGSLDCMHWEWKNCPTAWHGQFIGHYSKATMILEAVASHDLWFWHAFFGCPGSMNDINVLHQSPLFKNLTHGVAPTCNFNIAGNAYDMGYYLADGIYPSWGTLVQTISDPRTEKERYYAKRQEAVRKDVERAFGVLQARFAIIKNPAKLWKPQVLSNVMKACVIMHNMITEEERGKFPSYLGYDPDDSSTVVAERDPDTIQVFLRRLRKIRSKEIHVKLQEDLVEHLWHLKGNQ